MCIRDRFLGGLQRIEYVLVYPDRQDIVLAGPGEGWMVDEMGTVVGVYLLLGTYLNAGPHTSVLFENPGEKSIIVIFDGWDSKEAEELRRAFIRIRRLR